MSYDVDVADESFNMTSNLYQFFQDFDAYPPSWGGRTGAEVAPLIDVALNKIMFSGGDLEKYNAANGWGKWGDAIGFLMEVRNACRDNPDAIVTESH